MVSLVVVSQWSHCEPAVVVGMETGSSLGSGLELQWTCMSFTWIRESICRGGPLVACGLHEALSAHLPSRLPASKAMAATAFSRAMNRRKN